MSFILEALKRSQQERALGQVPRIDTGLLVEEARGPRQNPWVIVALVLAGTAVAIALYAALRETQAPPAVLQEVAEGRAPGGNSAPLSARAVSPAAPAQRERAAEPATVEAGRLRYGPSHPGAEPPAPRAAERSAEVAPPARHERTIPADLLDDVARFKEAVRRERQEAGEAQPELARAQSPADPREQVLPAEVQAALPAFLVTAHVYDAKPDERFVVINSLKYREGERSREGLKVLEILPDGVWLGFGEYSFFQAR